MKTNFFRFRFWVFVWSLALLLAGLSVVSAATQNQANAPREINFPYYSLRDGFSSTLMLVNNSQQPLDGVTVVLHSRSGRSVTAPSQTIAA